MTTSIPRTAYGRPESIHAIERFCETKGRDVFRMFYPRIYIDAGRYHSPKQVATMQATAIFDPHLTNAAIDGLETAPNFLRAILPSFHCYVSHRAPTFFIAPDLLEAIKRTTFSGEIDWAELPLPFEAGLFILPKGALIHSEHGDAAAIYWGRTQPGSQPSIVHWLPGTQIMTTHFLLASIFTERMITLDTSLVSSENSKLKINDLFNLNGARKKPRSREGERVTDEDVDFQEAAGAVAFGTFLAMNARPQLVERGHITRTVGKGALRREFWTPNIIGAKYKIKREVPHIGQDGKFEFSPEREHGTHASPRMHWRRGHFRNQPCGHERREHKTIWLEPTLVAAIKGEAHEQSLGQSS